MDQKNHAHQAPKRANLNILNFLLMAALLMGFTADLEAAKKKKKKKNKSIHFNDDAMDGGDLYSGDTPCQWGKISQEELSANLRDMVIVGDLREARELLDAGADAGYVEDDGVSLMQRAQENKDVDMVYLLMQHGAKIQDQLGAFRLACESGHMDAVRLMIAQGITPCEYGALDGYFTWKNLYEEYMQNKNLPFFEMLSACADSNFMDDSDVLAQDYKAQLDSIQGSDWRLSREVGGQAELAGEDDGQGDAKVAGDVSGIDRQTLFFNMIDDANVQGLASTFMNPGSFEILGYEKNGMTALEYAVTENQLLVVDRLLDYYASQADKYPGFSAHIMSAFMYAAHQETQSMMMLFLDGDKGCDINLQDGYTGDTIVMEAVWEGGEEVLDYLLRHNPKPDLGLRNKRGETAFMCAVKRGSTERARMLLAAEDPGLSFDRDEMLECLQADAKNPGSLHKAVDSVVARKKISPAPRESGMLNAYDNDGNTALIIATRAGDVAMVRFLLDIGVNHHKNLSPVNLYSPNNRNETAFDVSDEKIKSMLTLSMLSRYGLAAMTERTGNQKNDSMQSRAVLMYKCLGCSQLKEKTLFCAGCGQVAYCSRECQKADWKRHKLECKKTEKCSEDKEDEDKDRAQDSRPARSRRFERKMPSPVSQQATSLNAPRRADDSHLAALQAAQQKKQEEEEKKKIQQSAELVRALERFIPSNERTHSEVRYCREQGYMLYGEDKTDSNRALFDKAETILFLGNEKRAGSRLSPAWQERKQSSRELTRAKIKQAKAAAHNSKSSGRASAGAKNKNKFSGGAGSRAKNKSPQFKSGPPVQPGYARRDLTLRDVPLAPSWREGLPVRANQENQESLLFRGASASSAFSAVSSAAARAADYDGGPAGEQSAGEAQIAEDVASTASSDNVRCVLDRYDDWDVYKHYDEDMEKLDRGEHLIRYNQPLFPDGISHVQDGGEQESQYAQEHEQVVGQDPTYQHRIGYRKIRYGSDWLWVNMRHILYGDQYGGGHFYNEDKSCFPRWMEPDFEQRLERALEKIEYFGRDEKGRDTIVFRFPAEAAGEVPVRSKGRMTTIRGYVVADPESGEETLIEDKNGERIPALGTIYPIYDREYNSLIQASNASPDQPYEQFDELKL